MSFYATRDDVPGPFEGGAITAGVLVSHPQNGGELRTVAEVGVLRGEPVMRVTGLLSGLVRTVTGEWEPREPVVSHWIVQKGWTRYP